MFDKIDIIDNFLTEQDFRELLFIKLKDVSNNEKKVYHNRIFKNGIVESSCIEEKVIKRLHEKYYPTAIQILKKYAPEKVNLYEYSDFHIVITGRDFSFPIHPDTPNKLLSGVVYLAPEKNIGSFIYSSDKKENKHVEWKQNRALFFSRTEKTFHSYKSNGVSNRITLIYNLMTTNIRGVCKAEKTFYPYILFKQKINKYFLKYFNFTI